jgi:hypothetical protein
MGYQFFDEWFGEMSCVPAVGFAIVSIRWPGPGTYERLDFANEFLFVQNVMVWNY